ncbi:MAG: DUF4869 domain-containing protein [Lachnospiraceae bacterium]|nr:DUF4869 domain-containing protein [Lachnospiraceae bacterium]MCM1234111.1 DUF4869 domain-containing protein [Ruminococcus flavefaciens]
MNTKQSKIILHMGEFDSSPEEVYVDSAFRRIHKGFWLTSDYGRKVIKEIDKSEVLGEHVILSPILGSIAPEWLSGGAKTLIAAYFNKDKVYPLENLGDNCMQMLYEGALDGPTHWYYTGYIPSFADGQLIQIKDTDIVLDDMHIAMWLLKNAPEQRDLIDYQIAEEDA